MQIADKTVAMIDYTLTNPAGDVLDSSKGREPLAYLHGAQNIIPGLEKALAGKSAGEKVSVVVPAVEGYGERDENLVQPVPRSNFQGIDNIEPGMQFQARTPQGGRVITVVKVEADQVTIDANHPLAGIDLHFDVAIVGVRVATEDELTHGHAHGPDGHGHHHHHH